MAPPSAGLLSSTESPPISAAAVSPAGDLAWSGPFNGTENSPASAAENSSAGDLAWSDAVPLLDASLDEMLPLADAAAALAQAVLDELPLTENLTVEGLTNILRQNTWSVTLPSLTADGQPSTQTFDFALAPGAALNVVAGANGLRLQGLQLRAQGNTDVRLDLATWRRSWVLRSPG